MKNIKLKVSSMDKKEHDKFVNLYYSLNQAWLGLIHPDILSISFSIKYKHVEVLIYQIPNSSARPSMIEEKILDRLQKITPDHQFSFTKRPITMEQFRNYENDSSR